MSEQRKDRINLASALAQAFADLNEALDAEKEARGPEPAYDWGYYGSTYFDRINRCETRLADALDAYLANHTARQMTA